MKFFGRQVTDIATVHPSQLGNIKKRESDNKTNEEGGEDDEEDREKNNDV